MPRENNFTQGPMNGGHELRYRGRVVWNSNVRIEEDRDG